MQKQGCNKCINYIGNLKCQAFIDKIPSSIIVGDNKHKKPLPNQENNIVFEPLPNKP